MDITKIIESFFSFPAILIEKIVEFFIPSNNMKKYCLGAKRNPPHNKKEFFCASIPPASVITDISMIPVLDQGKQPACVGHAFAVAVAYDYWKKTGIVPNISPRDAYHLGLIIDGDLTQQGTSAASVVKGVLSTGGVATTKTVPNNITLSLNDYASVTVTNAITGDRKTYPIINDVEVTNPTCLQLKSLIAQYGVIMIASDVDEETWMNQNGHVPLKPGSAGLHETIAFGYIDLFNGADTQFDIRNSWNSTWGNKGNGVLNWSDYKGNIFDAMSIQIDMTKPINNKMKPQHTFSVNLYSGLVNSEITILQQCLNYDPATQIATTGVGSPGNETNTFGMLTKVAVIKFQGKYNIPETGYVGPLTRAQLNKLFGVPLTLVQAIIQVESGGDVNAIGDENIPQHAYGCMQIRQPVCDDVNAHFHLSLKAADMLGNKELSIDTFNKYMQIYEPTGTDEQKSRCWNAGPGWMVHLVTTDGYWSKVRSLLNE